MAEYIEREAFFAKCKKTVDNNWNKETTPFSWAFAYGQFVEALLEAPAADVVEVVRYKDCAWYDETYRCVNSHCTKSYYGCRVPADHFCSYGERKDGAGNG